MTAPAAFTKKKLDVTFTLGPAADASAPRSFVETGTNTLKVSGLRVSALIRKVTGDYHGECDLRVFGMTPSLMNQVCQNSGRTARIGTVFRQNQVTIEAGDDSGMSVAYVGDILSAGIDYSGSPDVCLHVLCKGAAVAAAAPVPPDSYQGGVDVAQVLSTLASAAGLNFENNGVAGIVLHDPYFPGTAYDQIRECAQHAGIGWSVDDGTLVICPIGTARTGDAVPISPATGLVGYPTTFMGGIALNSVYNGSIRLLSVVDVTSANLQACGKWVVNDMSHLLESEMPNGAWFTSIQCVQYGAPNT